jgi:hypothetical protein
MKKIIFIGMLIAAMMLLTANVWTSALTIKKGSVRGTVADRTNGKALDCSSIALICKDNPCISLGSLADRNGNFYIGNIPKGRYVVLAYFIGYEKKVLREVNLKGHSLNIDLGRIYLDQDKENPFFVEIKPDIKSEYDFASSQEVIMN